MTTCFLRYSLLQFTENTDAILLSRAYKRVVYLFRFDTWVGSPRENRSQNCKQREVQKPKYKEHRETLGPREA